MSWDAELVCDCCGHVVFEQNYTHNTNRMIDAAIGAAPADTFAPQVFGSCWWHHLDGMSGADGAGFLNDVIFALEGDSERYRAMNPDNGWGDYDSLLVVLRKMRDAVPEFPTTWRCSG